MSNSNTWRTLSQAAVHLGLAERTVQRRIAANRYPVHSVNGRTLVDVGRDDSPADRVIVEAQAVADDARRVATVVVAALDRVTESSAATVTLLERATREAVQGRRRAVHAFAAAAAVAVGLGLWTVTLSDQARHLTATLADTRQREAVQGDRIAELEQLNNAVMKVALAEYLWSIEPSTPTQ